jgi:hypothetical protein
LLSAAEKIKSAAMTVYRLFLSVDIVALFIALYFFFAGISDGSVSSFNIALWLAVLGGLTAVVGAGMLSRHKDERPRARQCLRSLQYRQFSAGYSFFRY